MWTNENRAKYSRDRLRYPSDLTDDEWRHVEPFIPPAKRGGGKRRADMRAVMNGVMYVLSTALPMALPSEGLSAAQHGAQLLRLVALRRHAGSHSSRTLPRMPRNGRTTGQPHCFHHRQSEREQGIKRRACIDLHGFDAGKLIKGKKRHVVVATLGLLLRAIVHPASIQDRDGGIILLATLFGQFPFLEKLFADGAYQGPIFGTALAKILPGLETEIVKRSDQAKGFGQLPKRWIVERTIAWLNRCRRLAKDWENLNRNALAFLKLASIRLMLRKLYNP